MKPETLPLVGPVFRMGADDLLFDTLLLTGPVLLLGIVLLGRTVLMIGLASGYIAIFVARIIYNFSRSESVDNSVNVNEPARKSE